MSPALRMSATGRGVGAHLVRGACGAVLIAAAAWLLSGPGILFGAAAAACLVAAAVLLRGCPLCWLVGLIEAASSPDRRRRP